MFYHVKLLVITMFLRNIREILPKIKLILVLRIKKGFMCDESLNSVLEAGFVRPRRIPVSIKTLIIKSGKPARPDEHYPLKIAFLCPIFYRYAIVY